MSSHGELQGHFHPSSWEMTWVENMMRKSEPTTFRLQSQLLYTRQKPTVHPRKNGKLADDPGTLWDDNFAMATLDFGSISMYKLV